MENSSNNFQAKRVEVSHEIDVNSDVEKCFALACPVEELKWINNWKFDMIYSANGRNEINCIFKEDMSGMFVLNDPELATIWQTTLYDQKNGRFHALLIYEDKATGKFEFHATSNGNGSSKASWKLTYTALNEAGNRLVDDDFKDRLFGMLNFLAESAKHYLEIGEMLKVS